MFQKPLFKVLAVFTGLSVALGLASVWSPAVAAVGWAIGTAISTLAGVFYGREAERRRDAGIGGALVGGVSIAVGCSLAFLLGGMPVAGVIAATTVGVVSGAIAGLIANWLTGRRHLAPRLG